MCLDSHHSRFVLSLGNTVLSHFVNVRIELWAQVILMRLRSMILAVEVLEQRELQTGVTSVGL